ncbi:MAG: RNA-directed DNA polymerase [Clostridia bacterium]|nr:RNA-directed DNA polymerase [Clostridia bacterium]
MCGTTFRPIAIQMYCLAVVYVSMIVYTELKSVEQDLGISAKTLFSVSNSLSSHYKRVKIPKKNGSFRELSVPDEVLKKIQRAIVQKILVYEPISKYAQAYKTGASVQRNASHHVGKKKILKLDIKHFFDSILYSTVKDKCFPAERFSEPIRILLSMLCYNREALPQGAPSSPIITNIIMRDFDEKVGDFCRERNIIYTRYCDDMTFSGDFDEKPIIEFVKAALFEYGYLLNSKKTTVVSSSGRQIVTGVVVNEKMTVPAEYKAKIRQEVYFCKKFGVENHLEHIHYSKDTKAYLQSLLGRVSFVLQTEPGDQEFLEYKTYLTEILSQI